MKIREMQRNFMIKLRQFVKEPEIESDDIEYYLNRAQEEYVKEQHLIIKDNYRNQNFNNTGVQRSMENLRTLIKRIKLLYDSELELHDSIQNALKVSFEGSNFDADPYAYYLRSRLFVNNNAILNCRVIDPIELNKFTITKYNDPIFREPAIVIEGNEITIVFPTEIDNFSTTQGQESYYELSYITFPKPMSIKGDVDCVLPIHTHNEIVDLGVNMKIEDLQKSRGMGLDKSAPQVRQED